MFYSPFTQPQQFGDTWKKIAEGNLARLEALGAEVGNATKQGVSRAHESIDEAGKLMKASVSYLWELGDEWRKQGVALGKLGASLMIPGA